MTPNRVNRAYWTTKENKQNLDIVATVRCMVKIAGKKVQDIFLPTTSLRQFIKTHVILAPVREISRLRAVLKIQFRGQTGQGGPAGRILFFHVRCKLLYLCFSVIRKVTKACVFCCFL